MVCRADWADECSVNGGDGESLLSKLYPSFDIRSRNEGSREFIPAFHNPELVDYHTSTVHVSLLKLILF